MNQHNYQNQNQQQQPKQDGFQFMAFWQKTSKSGSKFLVGNLTNNTSVMIFPNTKKKNENEPDYRSIIVPRDRPQQQPQNTQQQHQQPQQKQQYAQQPPAQQQQPQQQTGMNFPQNPAPQQQQVNQDISLEDIPF